MKAVLQRVSAAQVAVEGEVIGAIDLGILALVAVEQGDGVTEVDRMARKIAGLRIFPDERGRMHLSVRDVSGSVLAISQFTLAANVNKGFRPSFDRAETPELARQRFDALCERLRALGVPVATGRFGADMQVQLTNDGPVTFILAFEAESSDAP